MKTIREKIIIFAVLPLLLALCAIAVTVYYHAKSLAEQEKEVIEKAFLDAKDAELKNYVAIAQLAIAHLYEDGKADEATKAKAREILRKLEYSIDGYFFAYTTTEGKQIIHSKQRELEETNMWGFEDCARNFIIQDLIRVARTGGFHDYKWPKYSLINQSPKPEYASPGSKLDCENSRPKRAYVIELPRWGWMLGTGVYLDDVDNALSKIDAQVSRNIDNTMLWIAGIAFLAAVVIFLGLLRNIRERTALDDRLSSLTQRLIDAREEEDKRIKYLHGGIQSMLTAIKMNIEASVKALSKTLEVPKESTPFRAAATHLGEVLGDLRKIMKGTFVIDPNLPLGDQLNKLTLDMSTVTTPIEFAAIGEIKYLPLDVKETLFMSAKTALENIIKHARASQASVLLEGAANCVKMDIRDNGKGFNVELVCNNPKSSIGLRSIKEDLKGVGGNLEITSSPSDGTRLVATVFYP
ncbi:MAG TPA: cache domain-containing protein [Nitrosospira sp.]|nr:cache domain-containing protein [Nitrosospira sp.]